MKILGFNHFQLDSFDVEKTRAFYEGLGGKVVQTMEREGGWKGYHIRLCEGTTIEVQPPRLPETCGGWNGWDHVAVLVGDVRKAADLVEALGGRIEKQPSDNMLGPVPIFNAVTYGVDGEKIELIQIKGEEGPVPGPYRISHVQLNTDDVETAKDFYFNAFGGKEQFVIMTKDGSAVKGHMVEIEGGSVIEIQPPRFPFDGKNSAWNTIAIETDDIDAAIAQITAAGGIKEVGPFKGAMGTINILNAVLIGPAGEHIELIQIID